MPRFLVTRNSLFSEMFISRGRREWSGKPRPLGRGSSHLSSPVEVDVRSRVAIYRNGELRIVNIGDPPLGGIPWVTSRGYCDTIWCRSVTVFCGHSSISCCEFYSSPPRKNRVHDSSTPERTVIYWNDALGYALEIVRSGRFQTAVVNSESFRHHGRGGRWYIYCRRGFVCIYFAV